MHIDTHQICDYWFNVQKREAAKNNSTFVKIVNDPRITKVGKFIGGEMSEEERMRLDNQYADQFTDDNYSFWYDIKLILRTVPALFQSDTV